ncbi:hypothetical protein HK100_009907 [Physocladia obscura]|uniref:Uncharacterized protein n=1 Tax=Physocladia obscura TaxID=109957 RepID=A0AAD5T4N0_9FUNG|nr:hypothetical protein HK100_009907 [Physocladia obscura]
MESVEDDIKAFQEITREKIEALILEEKNISQELQLQNDRISSIETKSNGLFDIPEVEVNNRTDENLALRDPKIVSESDSINEIKAFQDYLLLYGGYNGGWEELSHAAFLKLRQKYGANNSKFLASCATAIPGIGFIEAKKHETWYRKFQVLLQAKKDAIKAWKEKRAMATVAAEKTIQKTDIYENVSTHKIEVEAETRKKLQAELQAWKEKQKIIALEKERKEQELRLKKELKLEMWREKNENLKIRVTEYTQEKALQEAIQKQLVEESRKMRSLANAAIAKGEFARLKQKDLELVERKKMRELEQKKAASEKEERLQKLRATVNIESKADPSRVLKPTKVFENRINAETEENPAGKFQTLPIPKR